MSIDEQFIYNFKKSGKFLYCENLEELKNISKIYLKKMIGMKVTYSVMNPNFSIYWMKTNSPMKGTNPKFFFQLRKSDSEEGSILFCSKQIKQHKPNDAYCRFLQQHRILSIKAMVLVL
jgi:hypothetical protein